MVYSSELGYDPEEWEECSEDEQFVLFGFCTRMFLTLASISCMLLFFWLIEARKKVDQSVTSKKLIVKNVSEIKLGELEAVKKKLESQHIGTEHATGVFSKEETEALEEWQREVAHLEELRLQDLDKHITSGEMFGIETDSQFIDRLIPTDLIMLDTNSVEMEHKEERQTSSSNQCAILEDIHSVAENALARGRDQMQKTESASSVNGWEAPVESEFLIQQTSEFTYKMGNVDDSVALIHNIRASTDSEDDFVKVYEEELRRNDSDIAVVPEVTELCIQSIDGVPPLTTTFYLQPEQEIPEQRQQPMIAQFGNHVPAAVASATCVSKAEQLADNKCQIKVDGEPSSSQLLSLGHGECLTEEENKRLAEAEMYVHDAIEYMANECRPEAPFGFVVEEGMLESLAQSESVANASNRQQPPISVEATSQMIRTNEIFEKVEEAAELDDAMTYAPEIQSIEIPPDQASISSENLLEYFDQVAAECTDIFNLPLPQTTRTAGYSSFSKPLESSQSISSLKSTKSFTSSSSHPRIRKQSSLLSVLGVTSMQEMLLALTSLEDLSVAMRKAGLQSTNLIFGIDYTASNKYQGERCFGGKSLHSLDAFKENPYQQVIKIMGRTLAPFATSGYIPAYGFGDAKTGDWSVFKLNPKGECKNFDEVLRAYNAITPTISLSGPTNFAPLIYQAIEICNKVQDYHILVIVADGQVTNEKATRKAIVQACQHPLSIIVVGVGDGPWDMMKVFDESLPKRPWDNFHFVEYHELMKKADNVDAGELSFAVQSLLEIPDQYNIIRQLGLLQSNPSFSKLNA